MDFLKDIIESISTFDLIYLIITIFSLLQCLKKGFVLSLLSASKWLLAYVITLIIFPRIKPYVKGVIDNEYVLDIVLGVSIFVVIIFLVLFRRISRFKEGTLFSIAISFYFIYYQKIAVTFFNIIRVNFSGFLFWFLSLVLILFFINKYGDILYNFVKAIIVNKVPLIISMYK